MTQLPWGDEPGESSPDGDRGIEDRFDEVATAISAELKIALALQQEMKKLSKACSSGDANQLEKALVRIEAITEEVCRSPVRLREAWGWSAAETADYIRIRLIDDLKSACQSIGLKVVSSFGQNWVALRRLEITKAGAVRAGKVTLSGHRPSLLAAQLRDLSAKSESFGTQQFAEMIASVINVMASGVGRSVSLRSIYDTMTVIPSVRKEYDIDTFTADVHRLKLADGAVVASGHQLEVLSGGGAVRSGTALEIFDDDGRVHQYSSVILRDALVGESVTEGHRD